MLDRGVFDFFEIYLRKFLYFYLFIFVYREILFVKAQLLVTIFANSCLDFELKKFL